MGRNHSSISVSIGIPFISYQFFSHQYNLNKVDWKIFKNTILDIHRSNKLPLLSNPVEILVSYHKFVQDIDYAFHKSDLSIDRKPPRGGLFPSSPQWWNKECDRIIRIRLAKLKRYLANSNYGNFIEYQKCNAQTTEILKTIKRLNSKSFCETISPMFSSDKYMKQGSRIST